MFLRRVIFPSRLPERGLFDSPPVLDDYQTAPETFETISAPMFALEENQRDTGWIEATFSVRTPGVPVSEEPLPGCVDYAVDSDLSRYGALGCDRSIDPVWDDFVPDGSRLVSRLGRLVSPKATGSCRQSVGLTISAVAHLVLLAGLFWLSLDSSAGNGEYRGSVVAVRLIDGDPSVPQEESFGTINSAASGESLAERRRQVTSEPVERLSKEPSQRVSPDDASDKEVSESVHVTEKTDKVPEEKAERGHRSVRQDQKDVVSPGRTDSVASIPSVAGSQQRILAAAGAQAADFRAGVISAIQEAAYFPKKALNNGLLGQAVVRFTTHRDGSISGLSLVTASGSDVLDEAALRIIEKASDKFPPFPESISKESVSYVVPIVFKAKSQRRK